MRARIVWVGIMISVVGGAALVGLLALAKTTAAGLERYTPTRLEWAALELQASHGDTWNPNDTPVMVSYRPGDDGLSIVCVIQYSKGTSANLLGMIRDTSEQVFKLYREAKKWPWLRLEFQQKALGGGVVPLLRGGGTLMCGGMSTRFQCRVNSVPFDAERPAH
ncbi:hypothetical protein ACFL6C_03820 [Myxococcota bacterium]